MGERKWHSIWRKTHAFPMESLWWVSMSDPEESLWKLLILETKGLQQTIDCSTLSHGLTAFMYYNQNVHLNKEKKNTEPSNKLKLRASIIKCLCPSQFSILCFKPIFSNLMLQNQAHLLHSQTGSFSVFSLSE